MGTERTLSNSEHLVFYFQHSRGGSQASRTLVSGYLMLASGLQNTGTRHSYCTHTGKTFIHAINQLVNIFPSQIKKVKFFLMYFGIF